MDYFVLYFIHGNKRQPSIRLRIIILVISRKDPFYKMKKFRISDFFIGIIFSLFFISIGVIFTVNFKPLYYFDINYLNIPETSGYEREVIIDNYDALIDYNSPFFKGNLEFPSLPSSPEGIQHFVEVKNIFVAFYFLAAITFIICTIIVVYKKKAKDYGYLLPSSITVVALPALISLFAAIDFDKTFVVFHKIFFRNDYWIFDPGTDPIINMLPQTFFLHALLLIILVILLGSLGLLAAYKHSIRRRD